MENYKVTVVVPVWGVEKYIERCATSLFNQTLNNIELIFIDDCTPDRSMERLEPIIEKFRLRFAEMNSVARTVRMSANSGLPTVRRHGIQLAQGQYITFCDSDDFVEHTMLEIMYNKAMSESADIVTCNIDIVDDKCVLQTIRGGDVKMSSDILRANIIGGCFSNSMCNKLIRRNVFINNTIDYPVCNMDEDNALCVQVAYYAKRIYYIPASYYKAYANPNSITRVVNSEKLRRRVNDSFANSCLILDFFKRVGYGDEKSIIAAKRRPKYYALELSYEEWHSFYPEIDNVFLWGDATNSRQKIILLLKYLHIYNFLYALYKII